MKNQPEIESGRAKFALDEVKRVNGMDDAGIKKNYKSYAKKYPSLVLSNGLAATVAFALDKGGAWGVLNDNVSGWLNKRKLLPQNAELAEYICSLNSDEYRVITNEVLSLFEWLRRFASGIVEAEETKAAGERDE
jgi:CRISPR-associated protein Cmr5